MTDREKIELGGQGLFSFLESIGPHDIYKEILIEVLFEELYGDKNIHLPIEQEQGTT